jgi:acetylornithine deacetylase/succinyl-diaminopimelate desuccinylase-like protein
VTTPNYLELAQAYEAKMVAFLQDLVRIPSVNGRHSEKAVAQRIAAEADKLNLPVQLIAGGRRGPGR